MRVSRFGGQERRCLEGRDRSDARLDMCVIAREGEGRSGHPFQKGRHKYPVPPSSARRHPSCKESPHRRGHRAGHDAPRATQPFPPARLDAPATDATQPPSPDDAALLHGPHQQKKNLLSHFLFVFLFFTFGLGRFLLPQTRKRWGAAARKSSPWARLFLAPFLSLSFSSSLGLHARLAGGAGAGAGAGSDGVGGWV